MNRYKYSWEKMIPSWNDIDDDVRKDATRILDEIAPLMDEGYTVCELLCALPKSDEPEEAYRLTIRSKKTKLPRHELKALTGKPNLEWNEVYTSEEPTKFWKQIIEVVRKGMEGMRRIVRDERKENGEFGIKIY